jgi:hypothetical protein
MAYLTEMNTVRTNGSSTAAAAQDVNRLALNHYILRYALANKNDDT